jgi:hypothetical protein
MSWAYKNISLGTGLSRFSQDVVAGFGFGADVDLPSNPFTIGTSQNYMPLLHNNQPLARKKSQKGKKHMVYGLRSVINQISKTRNFPKFSARKNIRRDCAHFSLTCQTPKTFH